jgi:hypothetical protein
MRFTRDRTENEINEFPISLLRSLSHSSPATCGGLKWESDKDTSRTKKQEITMKTLTTFLLTTLIIFSIKTGYCDYPNFPTVAEQEKVTLPLKTPYRLWYSEKQAERIGVCWGKLASGKLVLYTEATSLETKKYPSNFDDAEYQGIGDYVKKAIPRSQTIFFAK